MSDYYHHNNLSKDDQEICMQHEEYRTARNDHTNLNRELNIVRNALKNSSNPLEQAAKTRVLGRMQRKEREARQKMADLASLILTQPKVRREEGAHQFRRMSDIAAV